MSMEVILKGLGGMPVDRVSTLFSGLALNDLQLMCVRILSAGICYLFSFMKMSWSRTIIVFVLALLLASEIPVYADHRDEDDDDHERARQALEEGYALPLREIMELVGDRLGGKVIGIEFHERHHRYIYEFRVITPDGELREVYVDALKGEILKIEVD